MSDTTINTLKAALDSYRDAISAMTDDEWREILNDLDFDPADNSWPEWEDKDEEIRWTSSKVLMTMTRPYT